MYDVDKSPDGRRRRLFGRTFGGDPLYDRFFFVFVRRDHRGVSSGALAILCSAFCRPKGNKFGGEVSGRRVAGFVPRKPRTPATGSTPRSGSERRRPSSRSKFFPVFFVSYQIDFGSFHKFVNENSTPKCAYVYSKFCFFFYGLRQSF